MVFIGKHYNCEQRKYRLYRIRIPVQNQLVKRKCQGIFMSYTSINDVNLSDQKKAVFASWAKAGVICALKKLEVGRLVLEDSGETTVYGDTSENCSLVAKISVHNIQAYREVLTRGTVGSGESYMLGYWTTPDLLKVIRIMVANMQVIDYLDNNTSLKSRFSDMLLYIANINSKKGSRRNISAHYDLSNELFELFLDKNMMYSAAIFADEKFTLEQASDYKVDQVCKKLGLTANDHLLEIGTGWGGLALHAAKHYGCRVTTTTLSQQQREYAIKRVKEAGLSDRVEVLLEDYRDLTGTYDKLVSIEMIEAVGHRFYQSYFEQCNRLLKPEGLMLIQAITLPDQRYERAKNAIDFIQKYIFPGGCLPSNAVIAKHVALHTTMQIVNLQDISLDYAKTLNAWRQRFFARRDAVHELGFDQQFIRMWEFYLCYCEGGFLERVISTVRIVLAKPQAILPKFNAL